MKNVIAFLLILFLSPGFAAGQSDILDKEDEEDKKQPLRVTSMRMVSEKKKQLISFYGDVVAIKGKLTVESDEMYVYTNEDQSDFNEIEALGSVVITRGDKVATGEKANYYASTQQIILVGSPVLTQGNDVASGEKVIYYFDTEDMEVFGGENKRSTLILFPKEKVKQDVIEPGPAPRASASFGETKDEPEPAKEVETKEVIAKKAVPPAAPDEPEPAKEVETKEVTQEKPKLATSEKESTPAVNTNAPESGSIVWYTIQVGSHKNIQESIKLKRELQKHGYNAYIRRFTENGADWYRVRVGGFKTKSTASRFAKKLEENENLPTLIIPYQP